MRYGLFHSIAILALISGVLLSSGCTTTDQVVASWKGQPIDAVIGQWGPPGRYVINHGPPFCERGPVGPNPGYPVYDPRPEANQVFSWHYTTHHYTPQRIETRTRQYEDRCVTTTRIIPAKWTTTVDWFSLRTDHHGRVVAGDSSYDHKIYPFNRLFEKKRGWGSPRLAASQGD